MCDAEHGVGLCRQGLSGRSLCHLHGLHGQRCLCRRVQHPAPFRGSRRGQGRQPALQRLDGCQRGSRLRPHCMAAATISRCQCSRRFSARAPSSFTTLRADSSGTMWLTPSSTAFSMVQSIFSAVLRHCARPSWTRGSGSGGSSTSSSTRAGFVLASRARQHRPDWPSKTSSSSPTVRRSTRSRWWAAGSSRGWRGRSASVCGRGCSWESSEGRCMRGVMREILARGLHGDPACRRGAHDSLPECFRATQ